MLRSPLKTPLVLLRGPWMSLSATLSLLIRLPRYVKYSMHSRSTPSMVIRGAVGVLMYIAWVFSLLMRRPVRVAVLS